VRFLAPQPREDLAELFRAVDLVAVPSHNESFGLVAIEAQACGTPVVAAAVGGLVTAVRDGVSGVLVDTHRPADWAAVLGDLLAHPARRGELAAGAVRHAHEFSWSHTASGLLAAYRDALTIHRDTELLAAMS
jgi:D-inositol-3-phosphate glycosyltransferase